MVTSASSTTGSTSTASTATAQTVQQTATQQLLASLNAGSGIDFNSLATNLAAASFATRVDALTARANMLTKQISAASTIQSELTNLSSSLGNRVRQGDLSSQPQVANGAVATASLSGASHPSGSYSLEVTRLASLQTLASPGYASASGTVGSGTLTFRFGTTAGDGTFTEDTGHGQLGITVAAGASLSDIANSINAKNAGVTAYVANTTDGAKLVLKGPTGATNSFVVEASEAPDDPGLSNLAWNPSAPGTGRLLSSAGDAALSIDGLSISSASNTVSDAIPGVTLNLTGTNAGSPTQVTFSDPSTAITSAMSDLTNAFNEIMSELNSDSNSQTGVLATDPGTQALKRQFQQLTTQVIMPNAPDGTPRTLSDLGLQIQRDGSYTLDTQRLAATLAANPQAAAAMFTNGLYGIFATISKISTSANISSNPGTLAGSIARFNTQQTQVAASQATLATQQANLRTQMMARFTVADSAITSSKSTLSFLTNQIAVWNKSSR